MSPHTAARAVNCFAAEKSRQYSAKSYEPTGKVNSFIEESYCQHDTTMFVIVSKGFREKAGFVELVVASQWHFPALTIDV